MQLHLGDCYDVLKTLPDNSVDSIVTDPPYGLSFMGKKWDYDVPDKKIWKQCLRVLKDGGHLLAFGGTRTYHRLVVEIEDAGFIVKDQIQWLYGSGFPKSMNISKAIDKAAGVEQEVVGVGRSGAPESHSVSYNMSKGGSSKMGGEYDITKPTTPEAEQWNGWGTQLKPANEPICLAQKPISGKTIADNVLEHGTGGINIDECRIPTDENIELGRNNRKECSSNSYGTGLMGIDRTNLNQGRFPANVIFECICDETVETEIKSSGHWSKTKVTGFGDRIGDGSSSYEGVGDKEGTKAISHTNPDCPCRMLDKQAPNVGNMMNATRKKTTTGGTGNAWTTSSKNKGDSNGIFDGLGGASRFFYQAKASKSERSAGLTQNENFHPTVKPVDLMRYLCRLITPPNGTVLDPFMGSGSTGIGAILEGFDFIGIEMEEEYLKIAEIRIKAWKKSAGKPKKYRGRHDDVKKETFDILKRVEKVSKWNTSTSLDDW